MQRRPFLITAVSFILVLVAGAALAQVGDSLSTASDTEQHETLLADPVNDEPTSVEMVSEESEPKNSGREAAPDQPPSEPPAPTTPTAEPLEEHATPDEALPEADETPPELLVTRPADGERFTKKTLQFEGITEPGARVWAGKYEANVLENGEWHIILILSPGRNLVTFRALDAAGNETSAGVTAYYDRSEFTAHQKYGSCSDPVPYDVFYGTGTPGSSVKVASEYGTGSTTVRENGEWFLEVEFPKAPYGKTFPVQVSDGLGGKRVFEFTSYWKADVPFTARQKYGVSPEPWEKFHGTANPGTVVEATSEYGQARVITEGHEWVLELAFEGLTGPVTFPIVVEASGDHRMVFEFSYRPVEFTAHQKYGSCSESPPYDIFYGRAAAGTKVWVASPYGSAETVAGDRGEWEVRVFFEAAPHGEAFPVSVTDAAGHEKQFEFVSFAP